MVQSEANIAGVLRRAEKACKIVQTIAGDKSGLVPQLGMRINRFSDVIKRSLNAI